MGFGTLLQYTTMNIDVRIWSKAYAPSPDTDPYSIQVDKRLWEKAMQEETNKRTFLRIPSGISDDAWIAPLGQPVQTMVDQEENSKEDERYDIFLPLWMLDASHLGGEGDSSTIQIMSEEYFPQATRIKLRVIDSALYNADIKDELEKALSALGVIQEHSTLQIPVIALGGYTVEVFVSETEPANIVLCDGEEVALEFEQPVDQIEQPRPPTPIPEPPARLAVDTMIPEHFLQAPLPQTTQGFRPFQGEGHVIGNSNAHVPEWRRELGPPKRKSP